VPVEPRYLETVGLLSVVNKINDIREGWRHPDLHVAGILLTKMDSRVKGHQQMLDGLKAHPTLGPLLCGVIPANEAVAYAHSQHLSIFEYDAQCAASQAYAQLVGTLVKQMLALEVTT
jgi:cellulose biosynthesis protein BcsQ